jgi:hypothetical protein
MLDSLCFASHELMVNFFQIEARLSLADVCLDWGKGRLID